MYYPVQEIVYDPYLDIIHEAVYGDRTRHPLYGSYEYHKFAEDFALKVDI